jgi:hypothetical protein
LPNDLYIIIQLQRDSYGYDCARRRNLAVLDENTLFFVTGNLLHFLDIEDNQMSKQRSVGGSGISSIAVNT